MRIENTGFYHHYASKWKKEGELNVPSVKKPSVHQEEMSTLQKEAKELTNLIQNMHFEDIIREDKIRDIQEKMEAGTYSVSGKAIVSKLMGE